MEPSDPYEEQVDEWRVFESLAPHPYGELRDKGVGVYTVGLERDVASQDDVWAGLRKAEKISDEIDIAWCYAWEKPFLATEFGIVASEAPKGWSGNLRDVERDIQRESGGIVIEACQFTSDRWTWLDELPLKRVMTVRKALHRAAPTVRQLIEIHALSHKAPDAQLFLLAKAIEIVGAFFGRTRADRNSGLEDEMERNGVQGRMTRTIEWLFNVANERFDIRHAWDNRSPGVALHPRITDQERQDFVFNSDLIVRAFVCERLGVGIPILYWRQGQPETSGKWNGIVLEFDD